MPPMLLHAKDYVEIGYLVRELAATRPKLTGEELRMLLAKRGVVIPSGLQLNVVYDTEYEFNVRIPAHAAIEEGVRNLETGSDASPSGRYAPDDLAKRSPEEQVLYVIGRYVLGSCGA